MPKKQAPTLSQEQSSQINRLFQERCQNPQALFQAIRSLSHNVIWNRLGHDQYDLAEEAAEAAFLALESFKGGSQPSTYIWRILTNQANSWIRKNSRQNKLTVSLESLPEHVVNKLTVSPSLYESTQVISQELTKLSPKLQEVVRLRLKGLTLKAIAAELGISPSAAADRWRQAQRKLSPESIKPSPEND